MKNTIFQCVLVLCALLLGLNTQAANSDLRQWFSAVEHDHESDVLKQLLRGVHPNAVENERGDTALIIAVRENSMRVLKLLIGLPNTDLNARNKVGDSALMLAAYKKNHEALKALLDKGALVNQTGWAALHYAAAVGDDEVVTLLLEHDAYIDAESPNKTTPLMMAARGGHITTVKLLLDQGADPTLKNDANLSALDMAKRFGFQDIVEGLLYQLKKRERAQSVQKPEAAAVIPLIESNSETLKNAAVPETVPQPLVISTEVTSDPRELEERYSGH